ncbi:MAG: YcxB family protein [Bacteroidota bacterium]|nr:YcxB family protein [Bacteroidota bacterium]
MTSSFFSYNKSKVLQALRFHFITRKEIKIMVILVNLFAIVSLVLFYLNKVTAYAFLGSSLLWFSLMISFWFILPNVIYRKSATFKDKLRVRLDPNQLYIENDNGNKTWPWREFSAVMESNYFFHLYFDARSFFIIPKDAFPKEDLKDIRKFLKEKIKRK